ncbi:MAG: hypothetical protein H3Z51_06655 [archaeon]|nr:hypothetical protein [archaeon]
MDKIKKKYVDLLNAGRDKPPKFSLRIARSIAIPLVYKRGEPSRNKLENIKTDLNRYRFIPLGRYEIRRRMWFEPYDGPIIRDGKVGDGWVEKVTGGYRILLNVRELVSEIGGIKRGWFDYGDRIFELVDHELTHYKITEPMIPIEDYINWLLDQIEKFGDKYLELKRLLEKAVKKGKEASEQWYLISENTAKFFTEKYLRRGTVEKDVAEQMAEERAEEAVEEAREEREADQENELLDENLEAKESEEDLVYG